MRLFVNKKSIASHSKCIFIKNGDRVCTRLNSDPSNTVSLTMLSPEKKPGQSSKSDELCSIFLQKSTKDFQKMGTEFVTLRFLGQNWILSLLWLCPFLDYCLVPSNWNMRVGSKKRLYAGYVVWIRRAFILLL
jgi:hypothetical protein